MSESNLLGQNAWDTTPANFDNQYFAELNSQVIQIIR
jgi:hypothetical protein